MSPLEVPISAATSRTVAAARPWRSITLTVASMIAARRCSGVILATILTV